MSERKTRSDDPAPPKGKGPLVAIIVLVNVVAIGGGAAFFAMKGRAEAKSAQDATGSSLGKLVAMDSFIVNLNEAKSTRYLKVTFSMELADDAALAEVDLRKPVIRDRVLTYLSGLSVDDVRGAETKDTIRQMLVRRTSEALGSKDAVKNILFTEFVVQ